MSTINPSNSSNIKTRSNSNKRLISPEQQEQRRKRKKDYKMSAEDMNDIKNMFSSIANKIDESKQSVEHKLGELACKVESDVQLLKNAVDDFKSKINSDITAINDTLASHSQRLDNTEDDINRLRYANDLRLTGIPYVQNENLVEIFSKLASIINYDCSSTACIPILERLPTRNRATGIMIASPTILLHFTSTQQKQWFYSLYLNKMPLKSSLFGLQSDRSIILGENLTQKNAYIFKAAQNMRNEKKIAQVYTLDGVVKIKFAKGPNQRAHTIRNVLELEFLVEQFNQQLMEVDLNAQTHGVSTQQQALSHSHGEHSLQNAQHTQTGVRTQATTPTHQPVNIAQTPQPKDIAPSQHNMSVEMLPKEVNEQTANHTNTLRKEPTTVIETNTGMQMQQQPPAT